MTNWQGNVRFVVLLLFMYIQRQMIVEMSLKQRKHLKVQSGALRVYKSVINFCAWRSRPWTCKQEHVLSNNSCSFASEEAFSDTFWFHGLRHVIKINDNKLTIRFWFTNKTVLTPENIPKKNSVCLPMYGFAKKCDGGWSNQMNQKTWQITEFITNSSRPCFSIFSPWRHQW